jgi:zinc-binding in reverse transcriptase
MEGKLTFTSLVELALLCVRKNLTLFLFLTLYILLIMLILPYGCGTHLGFTQLSLYIIFYVLGVSINLSRSVWALKIPLKNKLFLWMVLHNKILIKDNLGKCGWTGDSSCMFCSARKTVDHLFFHCPFILDFWHKILSIHPQRNLINVSSIFEF